MKLLRSSSVGCFILECFACVALLTHGEIAAKEVTIVAAEKRTRVLLVQPVILCDDDGKSPARYTLPKKLVDVAYTKADLEFLYLDPVSWNYGKARRGEINLNTIVKEGQAKGFISKDPRVCTLLFVSAVDGNKGPLGRGMLGGNICFASLGPEGKMKDPAERAFVIAHEIGHCLSLRHTVDDPAVPDDIPNLQGDGTYEKRLAPGALHPTQVKTILANPLALQRRYFNSAKQSAQLITHDSWGNTCVGLSENTIRFELSMKSGDALPNAAAARTTFVRKQYTNLTQDFTAEDMEFLNGLINELEKTLGSQWPTVTRLPWNFIKMDSSFCNGFPHTRGLSIVLTDQFFKMARRDKTLGLTVLLHEKLHVIQRLLPARFQQRFREYGFIPIQLPLGAMRQLNLIRNPDTPGLLWAVAVDGEPMLMATTLKTVNGKPSMTPSLFRLKAVTNKPMTHTPGEAVEDMSILKPWFQSLPVPKGHDDPREVAAYLLTHTYRTDFLKQKKGGELAPAQQKLLESERKILPQLLELPAVLE